MTSTITSSTTRTRSLAATRAIVVVAAVAAAALAWVIIVPLLGTDVTIPESSSKRIDLPLGMVIAASTIASLAGWALLTVLERFTSKARVIWTAIAAVVLAATMPWDPEFTGSERISLVVMHLAVGLVLIGGFWRTTPSADTTA